MNIRANLENIIPISTIDWRGRCACVIFFNGCDFRCSYCQNYKLLDKINYIDIDIIKENILDATSFVSSVVFSGGECTLQPDVLLELAEFSKEHNLYVGIQTNGYHPDVLRRLSKRNIVDKIFLDVKAPPLDNEKYTKITGGIKDANVQLIRSLKIKNVDIEAKTTVFRSTIDYILLIAKYLEKTNYSKEYILQQGIPENAPEEKIRNEKRLTIDEMEKIANSISSLTSIRTRIIKGKDIYI